MKTIITIAAATLLVGCAARPERIAPANVEVAPYMSQSCQELISGRATVVAQLDQESREQRSVRRSDAWGVALVGMPVGRMAGGNRESEIAQLKGEQVAIDQARQAKGCTGDPQS